MIHRVFKGLSFTTLLLSYFFICGTLYLICFWGTFDIDISPLVNITDIPKSFVVPLIYAVGFNLFQIVFPAMVGKNTRDNDDDDDDDETGGDKEDNERNSSSTTSRKRGILTRVSGFFKKYPYRDYLIALIPTLIVICYGLFKMYEYFWLFSSVAVGMLLSIRILKSSYIEQIFPYSRIRLFTVQLLILIPMFCISAGKMNSLRIYKNENVKYMRLDGDSTMREYKFVGFIGDKVVGISNDNSKTIFYNQAELKSIEVYAKPIISEHVQK